MFLQFSLDLIIYKLLLLMSSIVKTNHKITITLDARNYKFYQDLAQDIGKALDCPEMDPLPSLDVFNDWMRDLGWLDPNIDEVEINIINFYNQKKKSKSKLSDGI